MLDPYVPESSAAAQALRTALVDGQVSNVRNASASTSTEQFKLYRNLLDECEKAMRRSLGLWPAMTQVETRLKEREHCKPSAAHGPRPRRASRPAPAPHSTVARSL
jgi:hypothetical protein